MMTDCEHEPLSPQTAATVDMCKRVIISSKLLPQCIDTDCLQAKRLVGGITNDLIKVWPNNGPFQTLIVRVFGFAEILVNRDREKVVATFLYETRGIGKRVFQAFEQDGKCGVIEEYLEGRSIQPREMQDTQIAHKIVRRIAYMHSTDIPAHIREQIQEPENGMKSFIWDSLWKWVNACIQLQQQQNENMQKIDFEKIRKEIQRLEDYTRRFAAPIVLSHNDLLSGNIFITPKGDINFIDFEFSAMSERGFDIANFFNETVGFDCEWENYPPMEFINTFIAEYNEHVRYPRVSDGSVGAYSECCMSEIKAYARVSHLLWGLWSFIQAIYSHKKDFDYLQYGLRRIAALDEPIFELQI